MKCAMEDCRKKAKVKISLSGSGDSTCLCYRHGFMYVKVNMQRLGDKDFGIYIQRPPANIKRVVVRKREEVEEPVVQDKEWDGL